MNMDDWQLLREFAEHGSEAAFREIVTRYGGLVYSVALRHALNAQIAEDVAQSVFILLARKAGTLREGIVVSGWLFQTTRFVAQRAARSEQRRKRREYEAIMVQEQTPETWQRIAPAVDEALERLGAKDRNALLLRFFEGRTLRDVGMAIGIGEEAAKKRVARALEKVRSILSRRGWHLPVAVLAAAMTQQASAAATPSLIEQFTAAGLGSTTAAPATALANEAIGAWRWAKLRITALGISAVSVLLLITLTIKPSAPTATIPSTVVELGPTSAADPLPAAEPALPAPLTASNRLRFRVVSAESGQAIPGARIGVQPWTSSGTEPKWGLTTDADGWCDVSYPADSGRLDVGAVAAGWAPRFATWPAEGYSGFASEYTLRLQRVTNVIGGWIRDVSGRPIANAEIRFSAWGTGDHAQRERPRERFGFLSDIPATQTDANGRWSIDFVPPSHPGFQIEVAHPGFATTTAISCEARGPLAEIDGEREKQLWSGTLVTRLTPALTVRGLIVDSEGRPIANARVQERDQSEVFTTDQSGAFQVPGLAEGAWSFTTSAEGYAPQRNTTHIAPGMEPLRVTLQPGAVLRLLVLDEFGVAVPDATVGLEQWAEHRHVMEWREKTDNGGRIVWRSAPPDAELDLYARASGFCWTRNVKLKADDQEHVIELRHVLKVYGRVTDAETGRAIRDFRVVPGYNEKYSDAGSAWHGGETSRGTNGLFEFAFTENRPPWRLRIVADGYDDWISPELTNSFHVNLDIALRRSTVKTSVTGVVLRRDGGPAVGAEVALLSLEHNVRLRRMKFEGNSRWILATDENGQFRFPGNSLAHSVAAVSSEGYAHLRLPDVGANLTLQLQAWGRVEGFVAENARAHPVTTIELYDPAADNYQGRVSLLGSYSVKPDSDGRFSFEFVPPGQFCAFINSGPGTSYHHKTPLTVGPGETTGVLIAEPDGALLRGRFVALSSKPIDWSKDITARVELKSRRFAPGWSSRDEETMKAVDYWTSATAREHVNSRRGASLRLFEDGSFVAVERVPAGEYLLVVFRKGGAVHRDITVSMEDEHKQFVDLGAIELQ